MTTPTVKVISIANMAAGMAATCILTRLLVMARPSRLPTRRMSSRQATTLPTRLAMPKPAARPSQTRRAGSTFSAITFTTMLVAMVTSPIKHGCPAVVQ